jgi:hypothetical protein
MRNVCSSTGTLRFLLATLLLVFDAKHAMSIQISGWLHTRTVVCGALFRGDLG